MYKIDTNTMTKVCILKNHKIKGLDIWFLLLVLNPSRMKGRMKTLKETFSIHLCHFTSFLKSQNYKY